MRYPFSKSASASPDTIAARWKIRSGREATSFSASPGLERSDSAELPSNGTTSCRMSSPAPSLRRRAVSLRPIMPAAPMTRIVFIFLRLPVRVPQAPPGHVLRQPLAAGLEITALGEIGAHHPVRPVAQVVHAEPVIGKD